MYVPSQSAFMIYLRVRWHISHIFHSCSLPVLFYATPGRSLVIPWTFMDISRWFVIYNIGICLHEYVTTTKPNFDSFQGLLFQEKNPVINRNNTI